MKTINLRKLYFSQYHEDVFVEVSDEVAEALLLMQRAENNRRQKLIITKPTIRLIAWMESKWLLFTENNFLRKII